MLGKFWESPQFYLFLIHILRSILVVKFFLKFGYVIIMVDRFHRILNR
jgi:hypothetical protein